MRNKLFAIFILVLMYSCTAYQSSGFTGGWKETQLDENVFRVSFHGNGYTSSERVADFCLLRSSELTLANGFKYFVIIDGKEYTTQSTYTTPYQTSGSATTYGNTTTFNARTFGGQTYNISKPSSQNTIVCFKDKPSGFSYNAEFLENSLKTKYGISEDKMKKRDRDRNTGQ